MLKMSVTHKLLSRVFNKVSLRKFKFQKQLPRTLSSEINKNNILSSPFPDVPLLNISIPEYVYSRFEKYGHLDAMECGVTGRKYTFRDLRIKAKNLSKSLRKKLKLGDQDVIAMLLPNVPEIGIVVLGVLESRMTLTTINPIYTPDEIARQLINSDAKALITLNDLFGVAKNSTDIYGKNIPILTIKTQQGQSTPTGAINFLEFIDETVDLPDVECSKSTDLAFLPYSSGTTGLPKGVELTHFNIVSNFQQNLHSNEFNLYSDPTDSSNQDVIPVVLPMFHIYGLVVSLLMSLRQGSKLVTLPRFTPENYISVLKNNRSTVLFTVPPLVLFMISHPEVKPEYLRAVKDVICGAAPLGAHDEERLLSKFGQHLLIGQGYGLTETSPVVTSSPISLKRERRGRGSVGIPVPNTYLKIVKLDDPTCTPLGPNETGELLVKGPQVMKGYHNKPKETEDIFIDGWMRTGDMVYYTEDKLVYVTDRLKELIKVKGFQVAPAELEEIIRDHPCVEDAAVIGVPHKTDGEVPRAYVIPKEGQKIDCQKLNEFVACKVAPFKQLRGGIAVVDSIPKTASGKILRREIRLNYDQEIGK